jgi:hypothetical protein
VTGWKDQLDEILPEPGPDLAWLSDPDQTQQVTIRGMIRAGGRLKAPQADLTTVLDCLFGILKS